MKIPVESNEWRTIGSGVWERTVKNKDHRCKKGFYFWHRIYHEIICERCGELGLARKDDINRGYGKFCSERCVGQRMKGAANPSWKGGRYIDGDGYIYLKKLNHPNAGRDGYVREQRFVMSEGLGRPLQNGEIVHHENEIKDDNRIENLRVMTNAEHTALHNQLADGG